MSTLRHRPATREEVLRYYGGRRSGFETYVLETYDPRTRDAVRHIRRATARVRDVDGVPSVRCRGEECDLFATHYTMLHEGEEQTFVASATVVRPEHRGTFAHL